MSTEVPISAYDDEGRGDLPGEGLFGANNAIFPSQICGNYELLERIARGGMGVVFKARDARLKRMVALKMISSGVLASDVEIKRFHAEAEAAANLDHPNIVPIYEVSEHDGQPFFSMRLVAGSDLGACISRFKGDVLAAVNLMIKVALAVHHAHQRGIIHRDLKPSNILVDSHGEPFLTDFGLAKALAHGHGQTLTGSVLGTPEYMSPEQARGEGRQVTTASDIFSLGAILYHLLTGAQPFRGENPIQTARAVIEQEPPRPSSVNPTVDRDLETICLKALEKEQASRYSSAEAFARDLIAWRQHEPITARPISPPTRMFKWAKRRPVIAGLSTALIVCLLALVVSMAISQTKLRRERDAANLARHGEQVRLAESLLREGNALAANFRMVEARQRAEQARALFLSLQEQTLATDLSLMMIEMQSPTPLLKLSSAGTKFTALAASPDQKVLYAGAENGKIQVWGFPLGQEMTSFDAHTGGVRSLAISGDGKHLISGGGDGTIKVWATGEKLSLSRTVPAHDGVVSALAMHRNGDLFASAGWDKTVKLWRIRTGELVKTFRTEWDEISNIDFSPKGDQLALGAAHNGFGLIDLTGTKDPITRYSNTRDTSVAFGKGDILFAGTGDGELIWDRRYALGDSLGRVDAAVTGTRVLHCFQAETLLFSTSRGSIAVWGTSPPSQEAVLFAHSAPVRTMAIFPRTFVFASADTDGMLVVWPSYPETQTTPKSLRELHLTAVNGTTFSPDGSLLLSGGADGVIRLSDVETGFTLWEQNRDNGSLMDVAFSPQGRTFATSGQHGNLRIWQLTNSYAAQGWRLGQQGETYGRIAFSPDGKTLAAAESNTGKQNDAASFIRVWNAQDGKELAAMPAHRGGVTSLTYSEDGRLLITGGRDGTARVWDTSTWQSIATIDLGTNVVVNDVCFDPDSAEVLVAGGSNGVSAWDWQKGKPTRTFKGAPAEPICLGVSKRSALLIGGLRNGGLLCWDRSTGRELHSIPGAHRERITHVEFSPDGRMFVSASMDAKLKLWHLDLAARNGDLRARAERARSDLAKNPEDGKALQDLGEWYFAGGAWDWAAECLARARTHGAGVSPLKLARCFWRDSQFEKALSEFGAARAQGQMEQGYFQLCTNAVVKQMRRSTPAMIQSQADEAGAVVVQPGPEDIKDIWTTSKYSYAHDGDTPGGGLANEELRVGGWGDECHSLLQFDLAGLPRKAASAELWLFPFSILGGGVAMHFDRIVEPWDWKTSGTGRDRERLWWADKPKTETLRTLPVPVQGQWYKIDITKLYNQWQAGVLTNYGTQLRPDKLVNLQSNDFYSSRFMDDPALRPKVVVREAR